MHDPTEYLPLKNLLSKYPGNGHPGYHGVLAAHQPYKYRGNGIPAEKPPRYRGNGIPAAQKPHKLLREPNVATPSESSSYCLDEYCLAEAQLVKLQSSRSVFWHGGSYEEPISESRMLPNQGTPCGGKPSFTFYIKQDHVTSKIWVFLWSRKIRESTAKGPAKG